MIQKILFSSILAASFFVINFAKAQGVSSEISAQPHAPLIAIGGFVNLNAIANSQSQAYSHNHLPDSINYENGTKNNFSKQFDAATDAKFYLNYSHGLTDGLTYGASSEFQYDSAGYSKNNGVQISKGFLYAQNNYGKIEAGNNLAANQKMKVGPSVFARAAGGINGKYLEFINAPMLANSAQTSQAICGGAVGYDENGAPNNNNNCSQFVKLPSFILIPQSPIAHGGYAKGFYATTQTANSQDADYTNYSNNKSGNGLNLKNGAFNQMESATKISYYSPRINGWQLGLSYTANANNTGVSTAATGQNLAALTDIESWALNYSDNLGNVGFAASITGEHGQFNNSKFQTANSAINRYNLNSYDAGFMLTYFGFTVGGSYGYWGKSLQAKNGIYSCDYNANLNLADQTCQTAAKKFGNASYYTAGIAYEIGPLATSLTYMNSEFQKNKYNATSFGIDYKMQRGLMPYIEFTHFKFDANQPKALILGSPFASNQIKNNSGYVALAGVLFAF